MLTCTIHLRNLSERHAFEHAYIFHSSTNTFPSQGLPYQTHRWFHLTCAGIKSVSARAISGWLSCMLCVKSWVSFSMDKCDAFLPKHRTPLCYSNSRSFLGLQWNDAFDFLIMHYSSSALANHRDTKVLLHQSASMPNKTHRDIKALLFAQDPHFVYRTTTPLSAHSPLVILIWVFPGSVCQVSVQFDSFFVITAIMMKYYFRCVFFLDRPVMENSSLFLIRTDPTAPPNYTVNVERYTSIEKTNKK